MPKNETALKRRFADVLNGPFSLTAINAAADAIRGEPNPNTFGHIKRSPKGSTRPWYRRKFDQPCNLSGAPQDVERFLEIADATPCAGPGDLEAEIDYLIDARVAAFLNVKIRVVGT